MFYPAASCGGKSVLVRQLRRPHLRMCPWCSKRSSMALTAAASPSMSADDALVRNQHMGFPDPELVRGITRNVGLLSPSEHNL